jgi:DNA-binding transcriptional LysR family regulator
MDISKIMSFKAVADAGSISGATSKVHLSQPALSLQIQALEYEMGIKLFERHNRGLILTEEGEALRARAVLLEEWLLETNSIMAGLKSFEGKIKIGTYTTASSYLLAPRLAEFFNKHPKIEISYQYLSTDEILKKVKNLELDCAVVSEVPENDGVLIEPFFHNELILVCAYKNKTIPQQLSKEELSLYPFLSYPLKLDYCYREVEKKFGKYLKDAPCPIESESFDTLKQSLLNDLGYTFMPEYLIKQELKDKKLRRIKLKANELPIVFSLITKKDRVLSPKMKAFRSLLIKA